MQISPMTNTASNSAANFKGLWGKTQLIEGTDNANMVDYTYVTCEYHPFKDESKDETKKAVKKYSDYDVSPENPNWDQYQSLYSLSTEVKEPLSFTETEYYKAQAVKYEIMLNKSVSSEKRRETETVRKLVEKNNLTEEPKNPTSMYGATINVNGKLF